MIAKDFHQQANADFNETLSLVIKPTIIRTIHSRVVSYRWSMHQLDVKKAFLHGNLFEIVYMAQSPCFIDLAHPVRVCHLEKTNYGLKQAPRAWFQCLGSFLLWFDFTQ